MQLEEHISASLHALVHSKYTKLDFKYEKQLQCKNIITIIYNET